jgi:hypothetical protein
MLHNKQRDKKINDKIERDIVIRERKEIRLEEGDYK